MRRLGVVVAVLAVLVGATTASAAPGGARLQVSGAGGQSAVLTVPAGGMRVEYPFFENAQLAGPDGTIGGVLIQEMRTRKPVGGVLLQNVPGFDGMTLAHGLLGYEGVRLAPGRYLLTMLGSSRHTVSLPVRAGRGSTLTARGAARPITRSVFADDASLHTWSDAVAISGRSIVVLGAGSGGDLQQAGTGDSCFRPAADDDGMCLHPDVSSTFVAPGAGASASWSTLLFEMGAERAGAYRHSGRVAGIGPSSTAAHSGVVITVPR